MRDKRTGQFGWVVLLLATAVILPTVCLLWFMTQAVRNERLAIRQKLVDAYQEKADKAILHATAPQIRLKKNTQDALDHAADGNPGLVAETSGADGFVLFGSDGRPVYPVIREDPPALSPQDPSVTNAWRIEFVDANYPGAARAYEMIGNRASNPAVVYAARTSQARCLLKAGRSDVAERVLFEIAAYPPPPQFGGHINSIADSIVRAKLMLAQLYADTNDMRLDDLLNGLTMPDVPCNGETWIWAKEKLIEFLPKSALRESTDLLDITKACIALQRGSLAMVSQYPRLDALDGWPTDTVRKLGDKEAMYGMHFDSTRGHVLCAMRPERLWLDTMINDMADPVVSCRILDNSGGLVAGDPNTTSEPFLKTAMGKWMLDWRMELYFRDASAFDKAANRQAAIYTWAAILVISLIGAAAVAAGFSINRQMKLNRLKNDFVATVTHELKTPLASMRVLVDTLLAGDCKDAIQEKEYLELIARENLRLSRLIDNFLTFSRMERNKKAFDIRPSEPQKIMADAAEAVRTKFGSRKCGFTTNADGDLPEVMADHDSIVTVLVNLLDNACKYSGDNKQINLRVFAVNGDVCFSVTDNGFGMTKRVVRRIFDRFYQADQSLARSAEGCGLGLSIVKFIVDAHKGRIDVESTPGKGSCFIVRLPAETN